MNVKVMSVHGPGWTMTLGRDHDYMLWAPQIDGTRKFWQASWDRDGGRRGSYLRGSSSEEVLACFPVDTEGRDARSELLAASHTSVG
jgi:hypothetical protein